MANVPMRETSDSLREQYPSNAHTDKEAKVKPEIKKVASGQIRKKSVGHKLTEAFVGEEVDTVGSYILYDVLVPALKSMISDMVSGGVEMFLFGEKRGKSSNVQRYGSSSYTNYGTYSSKPENKRYVSSQARARHNIDDVIFETRGGAEEVLSMMMDLCTDYGSACLSDLYEMAGVNSTFTDNKWGWTDLSMARVTRVRHGYILDLPRPIELD